MMGYSDIIQALLSIPTPEQLQKSSEEFVEAMDFSTLSDFVHGYPAIPPGPGLHALLAPDGVLVRVIDSSMEAKELHRVILHDVVNRMLRSFNRECVKKGMSFDSITDATFAKLLVLKRLYRVERL